MTVPGEDPAVSPLAELNGGFYLSITAERIEIFATASATVFGASRDLVLIEGRAQGLFIVDLVADAGGRAGIAGSLSLERSGGSQSTDGDQDTGDFGGIPDNLFLLDVTISLVFNTTGVDQEFIVPTSFLPLLPAGAPAKIVIGGDAPGQTGPTEYYFIAMLEGSVTLFNAVTLTGSLQLANSQSEINGETVNTTRLTGNVSGSIKYIGVVSGLLDLEIRISPAGESGVVGRALLTLDSGLAIPGVNIEADATLSLEINTFTATENFETFLNADEVAKIPTSAHYLSLVLDPDTNLPITDISGNKKGIIVLKNGLSLYIEAVLKIDPIVELEGAFTFEIRNNGTEVSAEIAVKARLIGVLDDLDLVGKIVISDGGMILYGSIQITNAGIPNVLIFNGRAIFELNTFSSARVIQVDGADRSVGSGVKLVISGSVTFANFATASGKTTIAILSNRTEISFDVAFGLGGLNVRAAGAAGLYYTGVQITGIALGLSVSIDANVARIIDINASGRLTLNTTNQERRIGSFTLKANSFSLALSGDVQFLKTIKFNAAFSVIVVNEAWTVNFNANINFFGIATMSANGVFRSDGTFNVTLNGGVLLGSRSFGMEGSFHFNIYYDYLNRPANGPPSNLAIGFSGSASVSLYGLGINWGGASIGFGAKIENVERGGRVPINVKANASVKILFVRIRLNLNFTIGYLELPEPIKLADQNGGDLTLNMGAGNGDRGIGAGATDETYIIEQIAPGTIKLIYSGREQVFTGVDRIIGYGGEGSDVILVREGVEADLVFDGGNGIDLVDYQGSGKAIINKTDGASDFGDQITIGRFAAAGSEVYGTDVTRALADGETASLLGDRIISSSANAIYINARGGDDFIQQLGAGAATILAGAGNDIVFGGAGSDTINGGSGADEIDGGEGSDTIDGGTGADLIFRTLAASGILTVNGTGTEDTVFVTGSARADTARLSKGSVVIRNGDNTRGVDIRGGTGTVQVQLLGGSDTVIVDDISGQGVNRLIIEDDLAVEGPGFRDAPADRPGSREGTTDNNADTVIINGTAGVDTFTLLQDTVDASDIKVDVKWNGSNTAIAIVLNDFRRAAGDRLIINAGASGDTIDAKGLTQNTVALELNGDDGSDTIVGSPFDDRIDGGSDNDTITGGEGFDTFLDSGTNDTGDTLIESFAGYDFGLFEDRFVVGTVFGAQSDVWNSATLENLNGIFENVTLTGGSNATNRMVVNDLDRTIRVNGNVVSVVAFDGTATLDAKSTGSTETYRINAPNGSGFDVVINDTGAGTSTVRFDGSNDSDMIIVNDGTLAVTGAATVGVTHIGTDYVVLNTAGGADDIAVQSTDIPLQINSGLGDDTIRIGTAAGSLTAIDAVVSINAFDVFASGATVPTDRGSDTLLINGRNDANASSGTIGLIDPANLEGMMSVTGFNLVDGSKTVAIHYIAVEVVEVDLGDGANTATITSTGLADKTTLRTWGGVDAVNIHAINGPTFVETGTGTDSVIVGNPISTTAGSEYTVNDILFGQLTIDGGSEPTGTAQGTDILRVSDNGDTTADRGGRLTATEIIGLGMTVGIKYTSFETLILETNDANNELHIDGTHAGLTQIDMGDEAVSPTDDAANDVLNIERLGGQTEVKLGQGNDIVRVNYDRYGKQTFKNGLQSGDLGTTYQLDLDGEQGSDFYQIGLSGEGTALIRLLDSGVAGQGADRAEINGTNSADLFLFRANLDPTVATGVVAALQLDENGDQVAGILEEVQYNGALEGDIQVNGRDGDDLFVFDDTLATFNVFGDAGDDTFQVGQLFDSARDASNPYNGLKGRDQYTTTQVTLGFLSNGISKNATLNGGTGQDNFTVYSNKAELFLFGDEDDDSFLVRSFVRVDPDDPAAPYTNINGGQGADFVSYNINAPVRIDGGDGFDSLTIVGSEFGDDYVITENGVFGGGLFVSFVGLEKLVVDALQGNDTFFIESTNENVQVEIVGGLGSDNINIAGADLNDVTEGGAITVVSNSLNGHNGLIQTTVSSNDARYNAIFAKDVVANIADNDEAGVIIFNDYDALRVFEDTQTSPLLIHNTYGIALSRAPDRKVTVTITPTRGTESAQAAGGKGVMVNGSETFADLVFDATNWDEIQYVTVTGVNDALAEGRQVVNLRHSVVEGAIGTDAQPYDNVVVADVLVEVIDNDSAEVLIFSQVDNASTVDTIDQEVAAEDIRLTANGDSVYVALSRAPTGPVTVTFNVGDGATVSFTGLTGTQSGNSVTVGFDGTNWNTPRLLQIAANNDGVDEGVHYTRITPEITFGQDAFLGLGQGDVARGVAANINADISQSRDAVALYRSADIQVFRGTTNTGAFVETWTITLNGEDYRTTIGSGANSLAVAQALRDKINGDARRPAGLTASVIGGALRITDTAGFSVEASVQTPFYDNGFEIEATANSQMGVLIEGEAFELAAVAPTGTALPVSGQRALEVAVVTLTSSTADGTQNAAGGVVIGSTWEIILDGLTVSATAVTGDTLQSIAGRLVAQLAGTDYAASELYRTATLVPSIVGGVVADATWSILLDGKVISYTSVEADVKNGISGIGQKIAGQITALNDGYVVNVAAGGAISISRPSGDGFSIVTLATGGLTRLGAAGINSIAPPAFVDNTIVIFKRPDAAGVPPFGLQVVRLKTVGAETSQTGAVNSALRQLSTTYWDFATVSFGLISGVIAQGTTWGLRLSAADIAQGADAALLEPYDYVAGDNQETLSPAAFDLKLLDDDAPTVEIIESGNSTDLAERFAGDGVTGPDARATDSFDIVLTGALTGDKWVTVDVTPLKTRTYNGDAAFDAAANFGEANRVQVRVAAPYAELSFGGSAVAGEVWSVTLYDDATYQVGAVTAFYEVQGGDTLATVRGGLIDAINLLTDYSAVLTQDAILITATDAASLPRFFVETVITPDTRGTILTRTVPDFSFDNVLEIEFAGIPAVGETWDVTFDGKLYSQTVVTDDSLATLAAKLAADIQGDDDQRITNGGARQYDVTVNGTVVGIQLLADKRATLSASGEITPVGSTVADSDGAMTLRQYVRFDADNWATAQTITVLAIDDDIIDGGDAKVFAAFNERVNSIRGPISVIGGTSPTAVELNNPILRPGETNDKLPSGTADTIETSDGVTTITDQALTHVNKLYGERPGFDPRINGTATIYDVSTFGNNGSSGRVDLVSAAQNILSFASGTQIGEGTPFTVDLTVNDDDATAIGAAEIFGTPDQSAAVLGMLDWLEATVDLTAAATAGTYAITLSPSPGSTAGQITVSYTPAAGQNFAGTIALELANAINAATTQFKARAIVNLVGETRLRIVEVGDAIGGFDIDVATPTGAEAIIGGTPVAEQYKQTGVTWTKAAIRVIDPTAGATWSLSIDGNARTALATADAASITQTLANKLPGSLTPVVSGTSATIAAALPGDFATGENILYSYAPVNANLRVDEADQVDTLTIFNGESPAADHGVLTANRLSGLGMGDDVVIAGKRIAGGITYSGIEVLDIRLGRNTDTLTVEGTHEGKTRIDTGRGNDVVNVKSTNGHTFITTGAGNDTINVGSDRGILDQITGQLVLDMGADAGDKLNLDDSLDTNANVMTLTGDRLTGLDMPSVAEVQQIAVRAIGGRFVLGYGGTMATAELAAFVYSTANAATIAAATETARQQIEAITGYDVAVEIVETKDGIAYLVGFGGKAGGLDVDTLTVVDTAGLIAAVDTTTAVTIEELRKGTITPIRDNVEVLRLSATSGTFTLTFMVPDVNGVVALRTTEAIAWNATEKQILAALDPVLNPNNGFDFLPYTHNVGVDRLGDAIYLTLQGALAGTRIASIDTRGLGGDYTQSDFAIAAPVVGQQWTVNVTDLVTPTQIAGLAAAASVFSYTAVSGDTAQTVAQKLAEKVAAAQGPHLVATAENGVLRITSRSGAPIQVAITGALAAAGQQTDRIATTLQNDGIGYHNVEFLDLSLGNKDDVLNIQGTTARTILHLGAGDERIYVSSEAAEDLTTDTRFLKGHLNNLTGLLNIDAGAGRHQLMISDEAAILADGTIEQRALITDDRTAAQAAATERGIDETFIGQTDIYIVGIAPAAIGYAADADGNFLSGVTYWTGFGDDAIFIDATHSRPIAGAQTVTSLNTGLGNDNVMITLDNADDFFALNTQGPYDQYAAVRDADIVTAPDTSLPLVVFGGQDSDKIDTGTADDIVFGDRGVLEYLDENGSLSLRLGTGGLTDVTDGVARAPTSFTSTFTDVGGIDTINTFTGTDIIVGGQAGDVIDAGQGDNIVLGDNGQVLLATEAPNFGTFRYALVYAATLDATTGGDDTIRTGFGADLILGGFGNDNIVANMGETAAQSDAVNLILGDFGAAYWNDDNDLSTLDRVVSTDTFVGGNDIIRTGRASDIIIGGDANDDIDASQGQNLIIGDSGEILSGAAATNVPAFGLALRTIRTIEDTRGGSDKIRTGDDTDIILGGQAGDDIDAAQGNNIVLGDNGYVIFETQAPNFGDLAIALVEISTTSPAAGGDDIIRTGYGADLILGGGAHDMITANVGETTAQPDAINLVFGDFGAAYWNLDGDLSTLDLVTSIDTAYGGRDVIHTGRGDDIVLGGFDSDEIYASEGSNIVLGDSGLLESGAVEINVPSFGLALRTLMSIADALGDDDKIATGASTDLIFGGSGDDLIDAGQGDNIVLGDNGTAIFDSTVTNFGDLPIALLSVSTQSPTIGGNDMITTGLGNDIVFGGAKDDTIVTDFAGDFSGTDGYDIVLGDHGYINFVNPETGSYTFLRDIVSIDPAFGGNDVISTGLSTDIILGGNGDDAINAGIVDNLTDVVFGDNAKITLNKTGVFEGPSTADPSGQEFGVISFNFGNDKYRADTTVDGVAGAGDPVSDKPAPRTGGWNELGDDRGIFGDDAAELVRDDSGAIMRDVTIEWSVRDDKGRIRDANDDTHSDIRYPNSADDRLYEGYLYTGHDDTLVITLSGLDRHYETFDIYVYLDGDDGKTSRKYGTVRQVTIGTESYFVSDPDGVNFAGDLIRVTSQDQNAPGLGNYVVGTGLSGGSITIEVSIPSNQRSGYPVISGLQIVGQSYPIDTFETVADSIGGDDVILTGGGEDIILGGAGGDMINSAGDADMGRFDADTVLGDGGILTFLRTGPVDPVSFGELREIISRNGDATPNYNDTILTGNGTDRVIGGQGDDTISTGDIFEHNGVDDATSGADVIARGFNFGAQVDEGWVDGPAGFVAAGSWTNFVDQGDFSKTYGKDHGWGWYKKSKTYEVDVASMLTSEGIRVTVGQNLDSKYVRDAYVEDHDQINADTQNGSLFNGYIYAKSKSELGVDVSGLDAIYGTGSYDVYLYIDAEDRDAARDGGYRLVSANGQSISLNDPVGANFTGEFIEYDPMNPSLPANVVIFRDVSGDAFELRINSGGYQHKGKWYHHDRDTPSLAGIQIVGGADKADVVQQGDHDTDLVLGDQGFMRVFDNAVFNFAALTGAPGTANDTILGGVDGDVLIGGDGNDTLNGEDGDDRIVGDNAEVIIIRGNIIGLDGFADNGKREYYKNDFDRIDPYTIQGLQLTFVTEGGKDVIEGGRGDDWAWGGTDDDTYVFAGGSLGIDRLVESDFIENERYHKHSDQGTTPDGLMNDTGDALDFSNFIGPIDLNLRDSSRQIINGDRKYGKINLSLKLSTAGGFEDVSGSVYDDTIKGNDRNNALAGNGGDDRIDGVSGSNFIDGGAGDDRLDAGYGRFKDSRELRYGEDASQVVLGGSGDDRMYGTKANDLMDGEGGNDRIYSGGGADILFGGEGNDYLSASGYNNILVGGAGHDSLKGHRKSYDVFAFGDRHGRYTSSSADYSGFGNYCNWSSRSNTYVWGDLDDELRKMVTQQFLTSFAHDFTRADLSFDVAGTSSLRFALIPFIQSISAP